MDAGAEEPLSIGPRVGTLELRSEQERCVKGKGDHKWPGDDVPYILKTRGGPVVGCANIDGHYFDVRTKVRTIHCICTERHWKDAHTATKVAVCVSRLW
jgi:hypothetical protein